jgi:CubicO group peptidase (beta-lactamase class C family)
MSHRTALLVLIVASVIAQRRGAFGQHPQSMLDEMKRWPQPELRTGLSEPQIAASIARYAKQLHDAKHFSGVVLAARAGKVAVERAYGLANMAAKTPNTLDTRFNIGSINKVFTKVAIAQLAEAGKLTLDDTIRTHLPDIALAAADKITISQLLEHRSGMGDIFGAKYDAAPPSRLRELADFVPLFAAEPLGFEPGSSKRYSNAGYVTLGLIVERLSGEKYRDYVAKHIFAPAKMTSTGFWAVEEQVARRAIGYTRSARDGELPALVPNTEHLPGRPSSAGGAFATARDLLRFWDALAADKLLSPKWTNWMINRSFTDARRSPSIGWAGGADGINAMIEIGEGWVVVAMANLDPPSASTVARGAMAIIRGRAEPADAPGGMRRPPSGPATTELARDVAVPAGMSGHLLTIEAKLDGKGPFRFVVDTGSAGMLRITSAMQHTLQLAQVGEARVGDPSQKNMITRPVVRVGSIEIAGARFTGVEATVGDRPGGGDLSGVIGLGLFANLTATLDYPRQELRLSRQPLAAGGSHVIAYTVEHGVPVIDIQAGGVAMKVDVDSGSPAILSVPAAWATKLTFTSAPRVVGKGRTVNNEFEIRAADLRGDLDVAGFTLSSPRVDIVDHFPVANLGSRFLRQYAVTFDIVNRRMALTR